MSNVVYSPLIECENGPLDEKVDLKPDFFTCFEPEHRKEITDREAEFYHSITAPYSVAAELSEKYISVRAGDGYQIPVKVYRPLDTSARLPALLFIHGGGFITCTPETHDFVPAYISAKAGVMAFNVDYRLAPEYKFPTGIEDCYDVLQWIMEHAEELKIDKTDITVAGDSSGGNFAAVLSMMDRDLGHKSISRQVLIYPVTDCSGILQTSSGKHYGSVGGDSVDMFGMYFRDRFIDSRNPYASPLLAPDHGSLPEALFIEAQCDALRDDGLTYAKLLQDDGVKVKAQIYKGMPHAFILRTYDETFSALNEIVNFIKQ